MENPAGMFFIDQDEKSKKGIVRINENIGKYIDEAKKILDKADYEDCQDKIHNNIIRIKLRDEKDV